MDTLPILKSLSNETRYRILQWLKEPQVHFGVSADANSDCGFAGGVCVGVIAEKSGLAQSVISSYLVNMQQAGLLESRRYGQFTYYRRNEPGIAAFKAALADEL
ncbi:helix-turn-helix transcriptional regulator [Paenibacillus athensensis]|uniref:ArsR family transcriptional regulator n=1 Tax=Paenibacillus athensensis TaxID=1967502 RepID=A0A4Y8PZF3_9BACL|nr:helix-turn-helix transcriptional regulator [Paenibacillus athensensis]MCD1258578.1 helix-turn-helix transcriptional regulator [Paenibacillus athensensis]